jgi:organic radical activating enzyme
VEKEFITADDFETFHNTPLKLEDRTKMLAGEWPGRGCEYCKHIEDAGGTSDRMQHLSIPDLTPVELETDLSAIEVTPKIIEVYFDNVCNLSCLYCWDGFSSKIRSENTKHGRFEQNGVVIDNRAQLVDNLPELTQKFWKYLETHRNGVKRFHFLGGEPFYQRQFDYALEWFEKYPCPQLEFNIVSNLNIKHEKFKHYIASIKELVDNQCLGRFDLTCSIDCLGAEQEYVRFGSDLELIKQNFEYAVNEDWIYLNFNQTLCGLTMKTSADLIDYVNTLRTKRQINHYFSTVVMTYEFLHPRVFGQGFFDTDFEQILANMPNETDQEKTAKQYMLGIQQEINTHDINREEIKKLGVYLTELDRRRSTNWQSTFPWLTNLLETV